jgi:nucleoid DNA-binding protein
VNTTELIKLLAERQDISQRQAHRIVTRFFGLISEHLAAGSHVVLRGFGSFNTRDAPPREMRVPSTGETVQLPAARRVHFRASPKLRQALEEDEQP